MLTKTVGWLGRQDSNLGWRDQNPLPYRLATPQLPPKITGGIADRSGRNIVKAAADRNPARPKRPPAAKLLAELGLQLVPRGC